MNNIFADNWELDLEKQFLRDNRCRRRAYICSPLSAETEDGLIQNMHNARAYMYYAATQMNLYARAPHEMSLLRQPSVSKKNVRRNKAALL